ncbi:MAG: flagellar assembly protein FliX [Rhodospirillales bacterium]
MSDSMKVGGPGRVGAPGKTSKKQRQSDGSFVDALTAYTSAEDVAEADDLGPLDSVGSLLSLQEAPARDDRPARRRAVSHATTLLDGLEELRLGLLTGSIPLDRLARLAQALRSRNGRSEDEELEDLIAQVELRTEVELAKLQRR